MRLLIVNGPNLNLLGTREPEIYGDLTFSDYLSGLRHRFPETVIDYFQSNVEGELINVLQASDHDGIVLNAGGYSHTSVALRDCVAGIGIPVVEVHISNLAKREAFRHDSLLTAVCAGSVMGFGLEGYQLAVQSFSNRR